jgi:hypothetical protein
MQYLLLIYEHEELLEDAVITDILDRHMKLGAALTAAGVAYSGNRLKESHTATTIGEAHGEPVLHDGPFAETREQLGGYYLIDVTDLDEALKWAWQIPRVEGGRVEVRPVWGM